MFFDFHLAASAKWDGESVEGREEEGERGERNVPKTRSLPEALRWRGPA